MRTRIAVAVAHGSLRGLRTLTITCVLAMSGAALALNAQASRPVTLSGTVVVGEGSGTPVPGVDILVAALNVMVKTDTAGRFSVPGLERGKSYDVIVTRIGLQQQLLQLDVGDTDTVGVRITMEPEPQEIDAVDVVADPVNPRLSDYYANRKAGRGKAIPREVIEEEFKGQRMVDVLRNFSTSVRIVTGTRSVQLASRRGSLSSPMKQDVSASSNRTASPCFLRVFVDGVNQMSTNLLDYDMPAEQIEAIELFAGADIPMRFVTLGNACGVVNILRRVSP